jgi:rieske iron-sulfur protein
VRLILLKREEARMTEVGPSSPDEVDANHDAPPRGPGRRQVLIAGLAAASLPYAGAAAAPPSAKNARPEEGDHFIYVAGEKPGAQVRVEDLPVGGPPALAWPVDSKTETVRDGSRLNQVLLIRLDPAELDDETRAHAADGVVAYAATCSHAQCPVTGWIAERKVFHCSCHQSEYDPRHDAKVVGGPAPRPLPALPLRLENGSLVASGTFIGRVGNRPA